MICNYINAGVKSKKTIKKTGNGEGPFPGVNAFGAYLKRRRWVG